MASRYLRTSDIARELGVHANTVRLYEMGGYLSDIPRGRNGYRQYTAMHLEQARLTFTWPYVGDKELLLDVVRSTASGDFGAAVLLSESNNDPAAAAKTLDTALAHDEPAPTTHRAQALIMRAGLAVSMDDRPLARRLLAEMRALPLDDGDRAAVSAEMQTAIDLEAMLK